jgi:putative ABC transport system permease protein
MDEIAAESLRQPRQQTFLSSLFAALAVILATSGLYALVGLSVSRRTREIGVRVALGADAKKIRRLVGGQGLTLALMGVVLGSLVALATTRFLSALLYGFSPTDPTTFVATGLLILLVSALATYLPARRAAKVAPTTALRHE